MYTDLSKKINGNYLRRIVMKERKDTSKSIVN